MGKLFGTDGIRGIAGDDLTAHLAYRLGLAVAKLMGSKDGKKTKVIVGRDTRLSGEMLESAIAAGLCAMGSDVTLVGVIPTPALAFLVVEHGYNAGIMISASHNPSEYNGLKVFGPNGYKPSDEIENQIEDIILQDAPLTFAKGTDIGRITFDRSIVNSYIKHVQNMLPSNKGKPRKVLFDLANGSASATAREIFKLSELLNWQADFIADTPDGVNINLKCGSTHMDTLAKRVVEGGYDLGVAFDGDADRCLLVDEKGCLVDGDKIMYIFALEMQRERKLTHNTVVVTSMTNLGFHVCAKENGIVTKITDVGDRYVLEEMLRGGYTLGGEQSGHIIMTEYATTGDGQMTAAKALSVIAKYPELNVSELFNKMRQFPQVMINVNVPAHLKKEVCKDKDIVTKVQKIESNFCGKGRIVLRPSGTENMVRIMLEGESEEEIRKIGNELKEMIEAKIC